jgi:uncharacterized membrane protein
MRWEDTITIQAPADRVWQLNIDVANWPTLTPTTMQRVELIDDGPFGLGSSARIKQPAQTAAVWTVTRFEPGREFAWQTKRMGMTMRGIHTLEALDTGCRNTLVIEIIGPGAGIVGRLFGGQIRRTIVTENACFKQEAERADQRT